MQKHSIHLNKKGMRSSLIIAVLTLFLFTTAQAQVFDINDPIVNYDESNPPSLPSSNTVGKWVITPSVSWNTQKWKSYIINGMAFRLRFPNNYDENRSEEYPMIVILHGRGFRDGNRTMNDRHLNNSGARAYEDAINSGKFDGFVLSPQADGGWFNEIHIANINKIITKADVDLNLDVDRVSVNGRSAGAQSVWTFMQAAPKTYAAAAPMAGTRGTSTDNIDAYKYMSLWIFQGELDDNPAPATVEGIIDQIIAKKGYVKYTKYKNSGHGIFDKGYADQGYFDFYTDAHQANPTVMVGEYAKVFEDNKKWVYEFLGKNEVCPGDPINVRLGITAGFNAYEWRKDGQLIAGANSNEYVATSFGTYAARFRRGSTWSAWSPQPVEVKLKAVTSTPDIQLVEQVSTYLPSLDGATSVQLELPQGFAAYEWRNAISNNVIGNKRTYTATSPGEINAVVTENFGCSSDFSNTFSVKNANGANGSREPLALNGVAISKTAIKLVWSLDLADPNPATHLEIYRSKSENGPFEFITAADADLLEFTDTGLLPNNPYYYKVRTINGSAASDALASEEIITLVDVSAPSSPYNLMVGATNSFSADLSWGAASDDVGVYRYDIYRNDVKVISSDTLVATVFNLQPNQIYTFRVKARDLTGNESPFSNRVVIITSANSNALSSLKFNENLADASGNNISSSIVGQPGFSTTDKVEGLASSVFNGNGYIDLDRNNEYIHDAFDERSIAFWIKQTTNTGTQYVFDEGGSGNGIAFRVNSGVLEFAVRNGGTQRTISEPLALNAWTHVVGIFKRGESQLFVNGIKVSEDTNLPFNRIDSHGNDAGIGGTNSSNAFGQSGGGLIGLMDDFNMFSIALSATQIEDIMDTSAIVSIPDEVLLAPENVMATTQSYESIQLTWDDVSDNETQFQIYRATEGEAMRAIEVLPAGSTSFIDSGLEPATKYVYQVQVLTAYNSTMSVQSGAIASLANLSFEDNLNDASGNNISTQNNGAISYEADAAEGTKSVSFDGSAILNLDNGNQFIHSEFTERSVAFWYKSHDTSGIQDIYDEGGSTNGIGIRLVDNDVQLTVQNGHDIFSVQAPANRNVWHHIMGVFQSGALRLYLDGNLVAERTDVSYTTVNAHSDAGGLGGTNGSNAFDVASDNFTGNIDHFYAFDQAMDSQLAAIIASANPSNAATTNALPSPPQAVSNLVVESLGLDFIGLSFVDESSDELYFEISRAINVASNFQLLENIDAQNGGIVNFSDQNLDPHVDYFYQVRAVNAGGKSDSVTIATTTLNSIPVSSGLSSSLTIRFDDPYDLNLYGTDADGDALTISGINLPDFATLTDYGDGSGLLRFSPTAADTLNSPYTDIIVSIADAFGGIVFDTLDLVINNNHLPELTNVADVTMNEGGNLSVNITAADTEGTANLTWTYELPDFAEINIDLNGNATLSLTPSFADHGDYASSITVTDEDGANATQNFLITVEDTDPNRLVQINFTDGSLLGSANWNNTSGHPVIGDSYNNLLDNNGDQSSFGIEISSNWTGSGSNTFGSITGNNSGIYPDNVMKSAYWTGSATEEVTITGLNDANLYHLTFFGSRSATNDRTTRYTVNGSNVELNAASNTSQTVSLTSLSPQNGELQVSIAKAGSSSYGYLNAMEVVEVYDDGQAPASARNIVANYQEASGSVALTWTDQAFNEDSYLVYRKDSLNGTFNLLATLDQNITTYQDNNVAANSHYYYQLGAQNAVGETLSEIGSVEIPNVAPLIQQINDISIEIGSTVSINVSATDDPGDIIVLSIEGLPGFGNFTDLGAGSGLLELSPLVGDVGVYPITIVATDGNAENRQSFNLLVEEEDLHNYFINFAGNNSFVAASPWNNYTGSGASGSGLNNIEADTPGQNSLQLNFGGTSWNGFNSLGETATGLYPNNVTRTALWVSGTQQRSITITGLSTTNAYDFTFYASRSGGGNRTTNYSINGNSVSLNASFNTNNTVSIYGIIPSSNGTVVINIEKASAASYGYINALVISGYQAASIPATPSNLVATPTDAGEIALEWMDNTNLESSYEVWRSSDNGNNYALLTSLGSDAISYIDNSSLQTGTTYYYKVLAQLQDGPTDFSNIAAASKFNMFTRINFNVGDAEGSPWNNTNNVPEKGAVYTNLSDDNGNNTGIGFEVVASNPVYDVSMYGFDGDNPFGENTGNNSGVVPDNVMRSTWWMDQGKTAELRFFNLDLSQVYKFSFFASRDGNGNRTSVYSINGISVKLNAANNINNIVSLTNLSPDNNGELVLSVTTDDGASFSYLGAVIMASSNAINSQNNMRNAEEEEVVTSIDLVLDITQKLSIYPNPYNGQSTLTLQTGAGDKEVEISVINLQGQLIYHKLLIKETDVISVELEELSDIKSGVYLVRVNGEQTGLRTIRLIKQ